MVVWQMPCESSSPPGSQLNGKALRESEGLFYLLRNRWWTIRARHPPCDKLAGSQFGPPTAGPAGTNPRDGVSTKTSGTFLNGAAGPKGEGQDARNNVVHRPRIQSKSVFKLTSDCTNGAIPSVIAPYAFSCKST